MPTSSFTNRFILDEKGVDRLIEIIESNMQPAEKFPASSKYEEGKKLLEKYFSGSTSSNHDR